MPLLPWLAPNGFGWHPYEGGEPEIQDLWYVDQLCFSPEPYGYGWDFQGLWGTGTVGTGPNVQISWAADTKCMDYGLRMFYLDVNLSQLTKRFSHQAKSKSNCNLICNFTESISPSKVVNWSKSSIYHSQVPCKGLLPIWNRLEPFLKSTGCQSMVHWTPSLKI